MAVQVANLAGPGVQARERFDRLEGRPLFRADWRRMLFVHVPVEPGCLQPHVPFRLDLCEGSAWVSLVAFTQERLRFAWDGSAAARLGAWAAAPVGTHAFFNVRTYVRHRGEPGIYFLAEWIPNALSRLLGPALFGLPYRLGFLRYAYAPGEGRYEARVRGRAPGAKGPAGAEAVCRAEWAPRQPFTPCEAGTRDEFLLERYTAFTRLGAWRRCFRIWHRPWPQARAGVRIEDDALLRGFEWWRPGAPKLSAHVTPGVDGVWIGPPRRVPGDG